MRETRANTEEDERASHEPKSTAAADRFENGTPRGNDKHEQIKGKME